MVHIRLSWRELGWPPLFQWARWILHKLYVCNVILATEILKYCSNSSIYARATMPQICKDLHNFAMTYHLASNSLLQNYCWRSDSDYPDATLKFEQQPSFLGRWQTQKPHWNRWEMLTTFANLVPILSTADWTQQLYTFEEPYPPTSHKTNCRKRGQHKSKTVSLTLPNRCFLKTFHQLLWILCFDPHVG